MEFDADWIWLAIFVGIALIRGIGSRLARAARKSKPGIEADPEAKSFDDGPRDSYRAEDEPAPIEPR